LIRRVRPTTSSRVPVPRCVFHSLLPGPFLPQSVFVPSAALAVTPIFFSSWLPLPLLVDKFYLSFPPFPDSGPISVGAHRSFSDWWCPPCLLSPLVLLSWLSAGLAISSGRSALGCLRLIGAGPLSILPPALLTSVTTVRPAESLRVSVPTYAPKSYGRFPFSPTLLLLSLLLVSFSRFFLLVPDPPSRFWVLVLSHPFWGDDSLTL